MKHDDRGSLTVRPIWWKCTSNSSLPVSLLRSSTNSTDLTMTTTTKISRLPLLLPGQLAKCVCCRKNTCMIFLLIMAKYKKWPMIPNEEWVVWHLNKELQESSVTWLHTYPWWHTRLKIKNAQFYKMNSRIAVIMTCVARISRSV